LCASPAVESARFPAFARRVSVARFGAASGCFTTNGFTALLAVRVSPRNCDFTRNWTAAKQGAPNVFP